MKWRLFPAFREPDAVQWAKCFPDGLGPSAFGSPAYFSHCQHRTGASGVSDRPYFLQCRMADEKVLSLPVLASANKWGRYSIHMGRTVWWVTPIEGQCTCCEEAVPAILSAARSCFTAGFTWWLPPWCVWQSKETSDGGCKGCSRVGKQPWCSLQPRTLVQPEAGGELRSSLWETYLITIRGSAEDYLAGQVARTPRQHVRASHRAGLEILHNPPATLIGEYADLYLRVWDDRGWSGPRFSADFFHGAATKFGRGGELVVMRYGDRVVGGGVLLYDLYGVHVLQATTDRQVKGVHPIPVLFMTAIERAVERGLRFVNLGGVGPGGDGLRRFKESWGAVATPVPVLSWRSNSKAMLRGLVASLRIRLSGVFGEGGKDRDGSAETLNPGRGNRTIV